MRYSDELPVDVEPYKSALAADPREKRVEGTNFFWLVLHQVFLRVGWIFKTESIVMPVFMAFIGGGPILQGCLTMLNRLGFSVPPVLFARRLKVASRKKWALAFCSFGMSASFGLLAVLMFSGIWQDTTGNARWWMPIAFLVLYGAFFALTGMNQLAAHALQGKVVRVNVRGRLFGVAAMFGTTVAVTAAWLLMPGWLAHPNTGFGAIFAFTAVLFALSGASATALIEEPDSFRQEQSQVWKYFHHSWQAITDDPHCRALAILAALFSTSFMLFPHYQGVGLMGEENSLTMLTLWVCVQNIAATVISLIMGSIADRVGNRTALHLTIAGSAMAPLVAVGTAALDHESIHRYSWVMFAFLGFTPVALRLLSNYALEIAPRHDHPRYVSTLGLCLAMPVLIGAPLTGLGVRLAGYPAVMCVGCLVLLAAFWQTFRIAEPRHDDSIGAEPTEATPSPQ